MRVKPKSTITSEKLRAHNLIVLVETHFAKNIFHLLWDCTFKSYHSISSSETSQKCEGEAIFATRYLSMNR